MPGALGWHPWFARRPVAVAPDAPSAGELELEFEAGAMYEADVRRPPVLRWPGFLELTIESDAPAWVVYDEPADAMFVEPETAAPDSLNRSPDIVTPANPLVAEMTWRSRRTV